MRERHHPQTLFTTHDGKKIRVDEDLVELLGVLRDFGVRTQYSCQGTQDEMRGYILADRKSFRPLLKKIYRMYKKGQLRPLQMQLVEDFLNGYRRYEISHFVGHKSEQQVFQYLHDKGEDTLHDGYAIVFGNSWRYGRRITVRFPHRAIPYMLYTLYYIQNQER